MSKEAVSLITKILKPNPNERATIQEIKQHPWFNQTSSLSDSKVSEESVPLGVTQADDSEGTEEKRISKTGPIAMNAFDLINMVGGAAMNRMFQKNKTKQLFVFTQFTTNLSADNTFSTMVEVLKRENVQFDTNQDAYSARVVLESKQGPVALKIQVYQMTPTLHMVECKQSQGNQVAYHAFYKDFKARWETIDPTKNRSRQAQVASLNPTALPTPTHAPSPSPTLSSPSPIHAPSPSPTHAPTPLPTPAPTNP